MKFALISLALSLVGTVSAGCHPNFQGVATGIFSGTSKWGLAPGPNHATSPVLSLAQDKIPDFRFEFSGRWSGSYIVRAVHLQGENLVVTDSGTGTLDLSAETVWNTKEFWLLDCSWCGTNPFTPGKYASGCTVRPEDPTSTMCVQLPPAQGSALVLAPCSSSSTQAFDFWVPS